jgi:hypothetical protein
VGADNQETKTCEESSRCITHSCMGSSATVPISHFCTLVFWCLPLYVDEIEQSLDVDEPSLLPSLKCFRNHYLSFLPCVCLLNVLGCLSRKELTKAKALAQQEDVQRPSDKVYVLLLLLKSPLCYGYLNPEP